MSAFVSMVGVAVVCLMAAGCGDESFVDEQAAVRQISTPECRWVCPKCNRNDPVCAMKCYLDCNGKGPKCGPSRCALGEVCCNESCGLCTLPGEVCTQQVCTPL